MLLVQTFYTIYNTMNNIYNAYYIVSNIKLQESEDRSLPCIHAHKSHSCAKYCFVNKLVSGIAYQHDSSSGKQKCGTDSV